MTEAALVLKYSHNIVEHLGLKLYQNKPTNVIAEVVSNAWDADATRVDVNLAMEATSRWIAVHDDGHGMTRDELATSYLIIGRGRRTKADDTSRSGRRLMGRKGIGKLAPFGIARHMDVLTATVTRGKSCVYWLRFDLTQLLGQGDESVTYTPDVIANGLPLSDLPTDKDPTGGQVQQWHARLGTSGTGTLVLMTDLSLGRAISSQQLLNSLGHRFTIAASGAFSVHVNGELATSDNMLPEFDFRISDAGQITESVDGRDVRYWIGFVKRADWPADQAGVGVYAHGKIAQDRPFTFGVKGKEIFTRYMFGVVEAEWLDELESDVISTDRTNVNWDVAETKALCWARRSESDPLAAQKLIHLEA